MSEPDEKPHWWLESERIKEEMGLPKYEPSRFRDGVYTHTVLSELEEQYDCMIQLAAKNPRYLDNWQVRVDQQPTLSIGRRRDDNGNTVYEISSDEFVEKMRKRLGE